MLSGTVSSEPSLVAYQIVQNSKVLAHILCFFVEIKSICIENISGSGSVGRTLTGD